MSEADISIEKTWNPECVIVRLEKVLDFRNAEAFKEQCTQYLREGVRYFLLDMRKLSILDSTGIGAIFVLYRHLAPLKGRVVFTSLTRPAKMVVQMTRTYKVFEQFDSEEEALEALLGGS